MISRRAILEEERNKLREEMRSRLEEGQVITGAITNITDYGLFIDMGGMDGLCHITDLSWGRVSHPEEIVQLDQKLNVVILDFDDDKKRIALGLKQLTSHPWDSLDEKLKVGDIVKGRVVVMADYGAFVELEEGIEGLVHISEMSWTKRINHPNELLQISDEIDVVIPPKWLEVQYLDHLTRSERVLFEKALKELKKKGLVECVDNTPLHLKLTEKGADLIF